LVVCGPKLRFEATDKAKKRLFCETRLWGRGWFSGVARRKGFFTERFWVGGVILRNEANAATPLGTD